MSTDPFQTAQDQLIGERMARRRYYIEASEGEAGPHTIAELRMALLESRTTESSLVRAEDETEKRPLSELLHRPSKKDKSSKQRKHIEDSSAGNSAAPVVDHVSSARASAEARALAVSLLKKGKPAITVFEALAATGVQPGIAKGLVDELIRLRQPVPVEPIPVAPAVHHDPAETTVPRNLQLLAIMAFAANTVANGLVAFTGLTGTKARPGGPEQIGTMFAVVFISLFLPLIYVLLRRRSASPVAKVRTFSWFSLAMMALRLSQWLVELALHS